MEFGLAGLVYTHAQSCPILCNPMGHSPPGSSVCGILQKRILEWVAFPSPGDNPDPEIEPGTLASPEADSFTTAPLGLTGGCV